MDKIKSSWSEVFLNHKDRSAEQCKQFFGYPKVRKLPVLPSNERGYAQIELECSLVHQAGNDSTGLAIRSRYTLFFYSKRPKAHIGNNGPMALMGIDHLEKCQLSILEIRAFPLLKPSGLQWKVAAVLEFSSRRKHKHKVCDFASVGLSELPKCNMRKTASRSLTKSS